MRHFRPPIALLCLALIAAAPAAAETLYKMIDKKGKVTYGEKPPKDFDGQVIRMEVDPNANTATLPKAPPPAAPRKAGPDMPVGIQVRTPADVARENLEKARKAYEEARDNPSDGDFEFIRNSPAGGMHGSTGGGTRRVPTEAYQRRLATLEEAVKRAESEADKLGAAK